MNTAVTIHQGHKEPRHASPCLVPHSHHQPPCHYRATSHVIGKASLPSVAHANLPTPSVTAFRCRWCHPHRATRINDLSQRCQARLLALPLRPTAATGHCQPPPGFLPSPPPPPSSRRRHHLGAPTVNGAPLCSSSSSALPPPHSRTPPASPLVAARGPTSHAGETGSRREGARSSSGRCPPSCQRFLSPIDSDSQAFARQLQPSVAAAVVAPELIRVVGYDPMTSGKRKALPSPSLRPRRFLRLAQVAVRWRMEGSGGGGVAAEVTAPRERSGGPRTRVLALGFIALMTLGLANAVRVSRLSNSDGTGAGGGGGGGYLNGGGSGFGSGAGSAQSGNPFGSYATAVAGGGSSSTSQDGGSGNGAGGGSASGAGENIDTVSTGYGGSTSAAGNGGGGGGGQAGGSYGSYGQGGGGGTGSGSGMADTHLFGPISEAEGNANGNGGGNGTGQNGGNGSGGGGGSGYAKAHP
uniref:Uncharacterized protein n=1 Tax=Oryza barthii TaxID=65489 RepID=A0A0D3HEA5_9ORYZ